MEAQLGGMSKFKGKALHPYDHLRKSNKWSGLQHSQSEDINMRALEDIPWKIIVIRWKG